MKKKKDALVRVGMVERVLTEMEQWQLARLRYYYEAKEQFAHSSGAMISAELRACEQFLIERGLGEAIEVAKRAAREKTHRAIFAWAREL